MSDINITVNDEIVNIDVIDTPVYVEVTNSPGPAGAGVAAGGTTGQVLAKASNTNYDTVWVNPSSGGVPYSGATGDVSLGEYGINLGNVVYDTTPTGIPTEQGATYWDADAETVALIMNGTIQKIGEDTFYHVRNTTGSTIPKGTAVRFSGTTGNSGRLLIAPMLANGTYPSQYYMGITSEELVNNADGKVYHFGKMRNINTSAFADGDVLYVSPSVAGALTATAPVAPNNIIVAAAVVHAANNGTLMIRTTLGSNINADEGVLLTTPTANQGLFYDSGLWVNKSITTALGYTPVPTSRTITINGVSYDLSSDRAWTIAAGISGSGTAGQVTYWSGASAVSGNANFTWDNSIGLLTVKSENSLTPVRGILNEQYNNGVQAAAMVFRKSRGTIATPANVLASDLVGAFSFSARVGGAFTSDRALFGANMATSTGIGLYFTAGSTDGSYAPALYIHPTSNVVVNGGGSIITGGVTDGGQRLQVYGDTLLRGSGATSATTALTVQNSSSTNLLRVLNNGSVSFGADAMFWDNANSRLGIGTNAPATVLQLGSSASRLRFNETAGGSIFHGIEFATSGVVYSSLLGNQSTGEIRLSTVASYFPTFYSSGAEAMRISTQRNLLIGFTTDQGVKLAVNGDTLLRGSGNTSATTALTVQNSSSTTMFNARNDGELFLGAGGWLAVGSGQRYLYKSANLTTIFTIGNDSTVGASIDLYGSSHATNSNRIFLNGSQVRITSASVLMTALPTSSAGLPTGALWNDAGTVKIV